METKTKTKLTTTVSFYSGSTERFTHDEFWTIYRNYGNETDIYYYAEDLPGDFDQEITMRGQKIKGVKLLNKQCGDGIKAIAIFPDGDVFTKEDHGYGYQWMFAR